MEAWSESAGIAAGHPATARAGFDVLREGGSAADAAVAASLASCVAETVMTGLAAGGHAVVWDAATARAELLDCFVAVPGLGAEPRPPSPLLELDIAFGEQPVPYAVGIASCAVPGLPAGLGELWRRFGRLPWKRLCEPAIALARAGVRMPPAHATCLAMLEPVLTMREGGASTRPAAVCSRTATFSASPGSCGHSSSSPTRAPRPSTAARSPRELLQLMEERGGLVTVDDLAAYRPLWLAPVGCEYAGVSVRTRSGLAGIVDTLARLPVLRALAPDERALALVRGLAAADLRGHTTNLTVVDGDGNACVLTSSLGLGSGDFLPGLDVHLNSMLGESELLVGQLAPGERMQSMMAPTVAVDEDGLVLAAGSAGGSRLRSALVQVLAGILDEGLDPVSAVERARLHPAGDVVHVEPGLPETVVPALEASGYRIRRWPGQHHYFGGTSVVARRGAAADPRRSGLALTLGTPDPEA